MQLQFNHSSLKNTNELSIQDCPDGSSPELICKGNFYISYVRTGYVEKYLFAQIPAGLEVKFHICGSETESDQYTTYYESPSNPPYNFLEMVSESNCDSSLNDFCDPYSNSNGWCSTATSTVNGVDYNSAIYTPTFIGNKTCTSDNYQVSDNFNFNGDKPYDRNVCMKILTPSTDCWSAYDISSSFATFSPTPSPTSETPSPTPKPTPSPTYETPYPTPTPTSSEVDDDDNDDDDENQVGTNCDIITHHITLCDGNSYYCHSLNDCPSAVCTDLEYYSYAGGSCVYNLDCCISYATSPPTLSPTPMPTSSSSNSDPNLTAIVIGILVGVGCLLGLLRFIIINNKKPKRNDAHLTVIHNQGVEMSHSQENPVVGNARY